MGTGASAQPSEISSLFTNFPDDTRDKIEKSLLRKPAQCLSEGCPREAWNGALGELCCRTCAKSKGTAHGAGCDAKFHSNENNERKDSSTDKFSFDIEKWTPQDVESWLIVVGYPDQAKRFKEEEISGKVLLMFTAKDFQELGCKKGPAMLLADLVDKLKSSIEKRSPSEKLASSPTDFKPGDLVCSITVFSGKRNTNVMVAKILIIKNGIAKLQQLESQDHPSLDGNGELSAKIDDLVYVPMESQKCAENPRGWHDYCSWECVPVWSPHCLYCSLECQHVFSKGASGCLICSSPLHQICSHDEVDEQCKCLKCGAVHKYYKTAPHGPGHHPEEDGGWDEKSMIRCLRCKAVCPTCKGRGMGNYGAQSYEDRTWGCRECGTSEENYYFMEGY